jgi:hypothetical protein
MSDCCLPRGARIRVRRAIRSQRADSVSSGNVKTVRRKRKRGATFYRRGTMTSKLSRDMRVSAWNDQKALRRIEEGRLLGACGLWLWVWGTERC